MHDVQPIALEPYRVLPGMRNKRSSRCRGSACTKLYAGNQAKPDGRRLWRHDVQPCQLCQVTLPRTFHSWATHKQRHVRPQQRQCSPFDVARATLLNPSVGPGIYEPAASRTFVLVPNVATCRLRQLHFYFLCIPTSFPFRWPAPAAAAAAGAAVFFCSGSNVPRQQIVGPGNEASSFQPSTWTVVRPCTNLTAFETR